VLDGLLPDYESEGEQEQEASPARTLVQQQHQQQAPQQQQEHLQEQQQADDTIWSAAADAFDGSSMFVSSSDGRMAINREGRERLKTELELEIRKREFSYKQSMLVQLTAERDAGHPLQDVRPKLSNVFRASGAVIEAFECISTKAYQAAKLAQAALSAVL
jgi:hypothetical protein